MIVRKPTRKNRVSDQTCSNPDPKEIVNENESPCEDVENEVFTVQDTASSTEDSPMEVTESEGFVVLSKGSNQARGNEARGSFSRSCSVCQKTFTKPKYHQVLNALKSHEKSHTGEKPYRCSKCDKKFKWKVNAKTHEKKCLIPPPLVSNKGSVKCEALKLF